MEAVLLAAGYSSRAGDFKLGWDAGGRSMLRRQIDVFSESCSRVIVVAGYRADEVRRLAAGSSAEIVLNPDFDRGMFSSVLTGVALTRENILVCPADYPAIHISTLEALRSAQGEIRIPVHNGRKGHPVFMSSGIAAELAQQTPDSNLREFIGPRGFTPVQVDDEGILYDIDTPEDYQAYLARLKELE